VKVRCDEGVANRIGPEPCAGTCEGAGEASVGECIGQSSSRGAPGRPAGGRRCKSVTVKD
jgi:hypothetical protein